MYGNSRDALIAYAIRYQGDWDSIAKAVIHHLEYQPVITKEKALTIYDREYPDSLRSLRYPPWVLFYRGDLSLLEKEAASIVGSRRMIPYGSYMTRLVSSRLAERYVIVSGLARGVDGMAHRACIEAGGKTIGVIGCGLDIPYPKENLGLRKIMDRDHLVLSEYPDGTSPLRWHFPWRNRILAALGSKVIVTQAALKSGTMCTVNEAISLCREVWCVPYPFTDENGKGCNLLISQGADILNDEEQLRIL